MILFNVFFYGNSQTVIRFAAERLFVISRGSSRNGIKRLWIMLIIDDSCCMKGGVN